MRWPPLPPRLSALLVAAALLVGSALAAGAPFAAAQEGMAPDAAAQDGAEPDPAAREREQLMSRLERLREETAATQARAAELGETLVDLAGDEAKLRQRLSDAATRVAATEARIADDEAALDALTQSQAEIRSELAARRKELAVVLMALQRIGQRPPPALFAGDGGPSDVVRGAILLNSLVPGLDEEAQALAARLGEAARLAADEELRWASLREDLTTVKTERDRLSALVQEHERRRALSLYERDRASADLARLAEEADTVEALIARLSDATPGAPEVSLSFRNRRGGLTDPVAGTVIGNYGDPTPVGGLSEGRTIAALAQSTVIAPMPATVLYAAPFRSYGHVLILDAGDGYHMVLTGLAESFVSAGETVEAGSPVGRMGSEPGRSAIGAVKSEDNALTASRPLLYVELRQDGSAIDSHEWWRGTSPDSGRTGG